MSDFRLIIIDDAGAVTAFETCSADIEQARDRARTWTEIGFQVELLSGPQHIGRLSAKLDRRHEGR